MKTSSPVKKQIVSSPSRMQQEQAVKKSWKPPEKINQIPKYRNYNNSPKYEVNDVTQNFKFLSEYDTKSLRSGYKSDSG